MRYLSTRGDNTPRTFSQAVLEGLAADGGLLVPQELPDLSGEWPKWKGLNYSELSFQLLKNLATDLSEKELRHCCETAYGSSYGGQVAPLTQVGPYGLLELIHGPTLAFKDVALQLLGRLFGVILEKQERQLNIVAATSGDTGSAAIYGMKDVPRVRLFVTHPEGRIAPIQRRQMTTVLKDNVFNIAVAGTFDDCQGMVKALSRDLEFKERYQIGAVNSINFARIAAQVVYYFAAYLQTPGAEKKVPAVFSVPTGNFGNILAAEYARRMGLPIATLVLASNQNNILPQFFNTGVYRRGEAQSTHSPAMDIQVASNFERYLYLLLDSNGNQVAAKMREFAQQGSLTHSVPNSQSWKALSCSNEDTLATAQAVLAQTSRLLDPHTATAWWALERVESELDPDHSKIVVATAHPAKFPDILKKRVPHEAPGLTHPGLAALADRPERLFTLAADASLLKDFVAKGVEQGSEGVFLATEENAVGHG